MKRLKYLKLFALILALIVIGCNRKEVNNSTDKSELRIDITNWEPSIKIPEKVIKEINFITLETSAECLIGKIDKLIHENGKIYILDKIYVKKVLVFTELGEYLYSIGNYGKGYGEFININDFVIEQKENRIFVLDSQLQKVIVYNEVNGETLKEIKLDFWATNIAKLNNSLIFYLKNLFKDKSKGYSLVELNLDNLKKTEFLDRNNRDINLSYNSSLFQSENIYYAPFLSNTIYKITNKGATPSIIFDFGKNQISTELIQNANLKDEIPKLLKENEWSYGIGNVLESSHFFSLKLICKNEVVSFLYSKESGNFFYGAGYEGTLKCFGMIDNIATNGEKFYCFIEASHFIKMEKRMVNESDLKTLEKYFNARENLSMKSNPLIISIEYNNF